jgi:hypothetical protein
MIELGTDTQLVIKNFSDLCTEFRQVCKLVSNHSELLGNFLESVTATAKASTQALESKGKTEVPAAVIRTSVIAAALAGDEVEYQVDERFAYDLFLSHKQANGAGKK